jgi:predicted metallo-beta-lactamase superfamily hydrolase
MFQKTGGKFAKKLEITDEKTLIFGKSTRVRFSAPVFHGPESSVLRWVIMVVPECPDKKFMFTLPLSFQFAKLEIPVRVTGD